MNTQVQDSIRVIEQEFELLRNDENAYFMAKYMKNHFPFYGIKTPLRREILKNALKNHPKIIKEHRFELVFACLDKPEREWHQLAVDILLKFQRANTSHDLVELERVILTHSWWDTVDMLATNVVGPLLKRQPEAIPDWIERWRNHESMWLNRTAILFQLKYKKDLDTDLLSDIIVQFSKSKEFFIQKAIGWILRDYSRVNPAWVQQFVDSHPLKPLSIREATRLMKKKS